MIVLMAAICDLAFIKQEIENKRLMNNLSNTVDLVRNSLNLLIEGLDPTLHSTATQITALSVVSDEVSPFLYFNYVLVHMLLFFHRRMMDSCPNKAERREQVVVNDTRRHLSSEFVTDSQVNQEGPFHNNAQYK